jgi:hypothetical protein
MKSGEEIIMIVVVGACMLQVLANAKAKDEEKQEGNKRVGIEKEEKERGMKLLEEKMERGEELRRSWKR